MNLKKLQNDLQNNNITKEQVQDLINLVNKKNEIINNIKLELINLITLPGIEKILNIIRRNKND